MLKIHHLFLRIFVLVFFGTLAGVVIISYFWLKNTHIKEYEKNLTNNIEIFSVTLNSLDNLDEQVNKIKQNTGLRVTIIDKNGVVIAESDKNKSTMDNHLNREEILNINNNGFGKAIRKSETIDKDMLNIVKKVEINDEILYIRMGAYLISVENRFFNLTLQIGAIFSIFLLICLGIIYFISKKLQTQTNLILYYLKKLTRKNGSEKSNLEVMNFGYIYEFYQIAQLLNKVSQKLIKKNKLKAKYTNILKLANVQKDEIISAMSHEFKNPIAIISGYSQTLLDDKDLSKSQQRIFLRKIENSSNKLSMLIDRLRLSLKLEQNSQKEFLKKMDLKILCLNVIDNLKQKYKDREIEITAKNVTKEVDEALFAQVIENLVENALKYSQGKVAIILEEDSLSIVDCGIGIKKDELEKIQKKFYRVSKNDWDNSFGLGLFIVKKILKLHNFTLKIDSVYEKGSTFIIKF